MSELGFQHTTGSSNIGLTFIRPLPQGSAAHSSDAEGSSSRGLALTLADRLFPPRSLEENGSAPPVAGVELGHFVIEERIGRGGMGAVFRATDKRLGRVVAVKVLTTEHSSDHEAVLRFQNEARAAARLDHENIARVHYIGEEHGLHFIAFEFVMGMNVRNLIVQRGQLPTTEAINYTLQIAEALRQTNAANVVHRDIKPSNIIISPSGRAKLVDLGLARHSHPDMSRELTTVGTALGTFDYIAPEQALDARNVDVRSDIYSLGCTLYHMLTGSPPYPTGTMFEKVMNHHRPVPPNPAEKNRRISPQLARVVQKMMAANPDDRYASPESLIEDLLDIAAALGLQPTPPDAMIWRVLPREPRFSRWNGIRTWTTVSLILVAVVLADRLRSLPVVTSLPDDSRSVVSTSEPVATTPQNVRPGSLDLPKVELGEKADLPTPSLVPEMAAPAQATTGSSFPLRLPEDLFTTGETSPVDRTPPFSPLLGASLNSGDLLLSKKPESLLSSPPEAASPPTQNVSPSSLPAAAVESTPASETAAVSTPRSMPVTAVPPAAVTALEFVAVRPATNGNADSEERISRPTLAAACAVAKDGWAVEIPVGAAPLTQLETIAITDKKLRIRPSRDYRPGVDSRPVIRVDLSSQLSMGSRSWTAQMLRIERGAVDLYDLDIELLVDAASIADWSMVTLINGSRLTAQGVSFTMINPMNSRATLVNLPPLENAELGDLMPDRTQPRQNIVELKECLVRGQFDFLVQQNTTSLSVNLQNTALALGGCLIRVDGADASLMAMETDENRLTEISLDHVTLVAARGLLNANSGDHGSLPVIKIELNGSVCSVLGDPQLKQPLMEIAGHEDYELLVDQIAFKDNRDVTFLRLAGPFSLFDSTRAQLPGVGREMTADELGLRNVQVVSTDLTRLPDTFKLTDWHRIQPTDLQLRSGTDNPAFAASGDLQNAGVNWQSARLPPALPSENGPENAAD